MILEYNYWYFKSAIPSYICDQIVELGLNKMQEYKEKYGDQVITGSTGGWKQKQEGKDTVPINDETLDDLSQKGVDLEKSHSRDSDVVFLNNAELYDLVWPYIKTANKNANWNFDWDYTEDFQFTKYGVGQFYGWHTDSGSTPYQKFDPAVDPVHLNPDGTPFLDQFGLPMPEDHNKTENPRMIGKIRKISVTISLNDPAEYDGGNLKFDLGPHRPDRYYECTEIRPKGSVIVFPSHINHQVTPVTRGTRYSLVCWNLGAPFK
jgi:hypothetical protein